jgi:Protein of unknown function (DUF1493)
MDRNLAAGALEERVFMFTAIQSHVNRKKLTPMTRLAQDLDIKGEDASEFFDAFGKEFHVDLSGLNMHWDQHFHPEPGFLLNAAFGVLGCVTLAASLLALFRFGGFYWSYTYISPQAYNKPIWLGSGIASLCYWVVTWYRDRIAIPITIADLIDAADAGRWVRSYRQTVVAK